jgi:hypothetical protein
MKRLALGFFLLLLSTCSAAESFSILTGTAVQTGQNPGGPSNPIHLELFGNGIFISADSPGDSLNGTRSELDLSNTSSLTISGTWFLCCESSLTTGTAVLDGTTHAGAIFGVGVVSFHSTIMAPLSSLQDTFSVTLPIVYSGSFDIWPNFMAALNGNRADAIALGIQMVGTGTASMTFQREFPAGTLGGNLFRETSATFTFDGAQDVPEPSFVVPMVTVLLPQLVFRRLRKR